MRARQDFRDSSLQEVDWSAKALAASPSCSPALSGSWWLRSLASAEPDADRDPGAEGARGREPVAGPALRRPLRGARRGGQRLERGQGAVPEQPERGRDVHQGHDRPTTESSRSPPSWRCASATRWRCSAASPPRWRAASSTSSSARPRATSRAARATSWPAITSTDARFVERVVARGEFTLAEFQLVKNQRPLQSLRQVLSGDADCALLDDAQLAELQHLQGADGVKVVWKSKLLPPMAVVAFASAPAAERKAFQANLSSVCEGRREHGVRGGGDPCARPGERERLRGGDVRCMAAERVAPDPGAARPPARGGLRHAARRREPRAEAAAERRDALVTCGRARGADRARRRHAGGSRVRVRGDPQPRSGHRRLRVRARGRDGPPRPAARSPGREPGRRGGALGAAQPRRSTRTSATARRPGCSARST